MPLLRSLQQKDKVLQQKNALLKNSVPDCGILDVFDEELAIYGADIIRTRASFIEKISLISNGIHSDLTESREDFRVSYKSDIPVSKDKTKGIRESRKLESETNLEKNSIQSRLQNETKAIESKSNDLLIDASKQQKTEEKVKNEYDLENETSIENILKQINNEMW